jgi:hypothetical protein
LALRSAACLWTAESKSARGISFKTWEKMLHTVDKAAPSSDGESLTNRTYQIDAALPLYRTYCSKLLFWTRVTLSVNAQHVPAGGSGRHMPDRSRVAGSRTGIQNEAPLRHAQVRCKEGRGTIWGSVPRSGRVDKGAVGDTYRSHAEQC